MNLRIKWLKIVLLGIILCSYAIYPLNAQNLVKNPDFETGELALPWIKWEKYVNAIVTIDTDEVYSGNFSIELSGPGAYLFQPVILEPNTTYIIGAAIKCGPGETVYFGVENVYYSGKDSRTISDTNYKKYSWTFTTDNSPGNDPRIYLWKESGAGIIWADSIFLMKNTSANQPNPPGGFSTYYVSPLGSDSNTGTSPGNPWKTIGKVNSIAFGPTDKILFEGGKTFNGTLVLNAEDHGATDSNVVISSYGTGRATINAQNGSGLIAYDCTDVSISNLNFTGSGRISGNTGNGITFSYCSNILIDSIDISGFQHSGLKISNMGENYNIRNVHAYNNGYAGIHVSGIGKTSLSNIYIGYSSAFNNPGDPTVLNNHSGNGIYIYNAGNVTIEYCTASDNGWDMPWNGNGPGGIWTAEADKVLIQHCISHDNKTPAGAKDGLGFDLDGGTTNSTIQYCLSYNNQGAGFGIFQYAEASDWYNNTIRYCVSENDGNTSAPGSVYLWNGTGNPDKFRNLEFYNNVIYNTLGPAISFLDHKNSNFNFRNNIFVSDEISVHNGINGENFQGNCWYSLGGNFIIGAPPAVDFNTWAMNNNQEMLNGKIVGMFANPLLKNPGNSTITNPLILSDTDDYYVIEDSPVINSGLDMETEFGIDPGMHDYFGNLIKHGIAYDMGAHEYIDPAWQNQDLSLSAGWNIISFRVVPEDSNLLNIVQPLIDAGVLKKVMDETGKTIEDWGTYGGWKNEIGNVNNTEGYKVNLASAATLNVDGIAVVLAYEIPLKLGWNIISWPSANEQNGMDVVQSLIADGHLTKVMDESGNTIEDWGTFGGWKNFIGDFTPGKGYKVNVTDTCTLTIYENITKSDEIVQELVKSNYFIPAFKGNGTDHMNINLVNLNNSGIKEGDEIGVFDGSVCVGSTKIIYRYPEINEAMVGIPVSAMDGTNGRNGYTDGNEILIKLFRDGIEYPLTIEPLNNISAVFNRGGTLFAKVDMATAKEEDLPLSQTEIECYPNPFSESIAIELKLKSDSQVQIQVLNQLGQLVKMVKPKQILNEGVHQLRWDGKNSNNMDVPFGIYHLRFEVDNSIVHKRIILAK